MPAPGADCHCARARGRRSCGRTLATLLLAAAALFIARPAAAVTAIEIEAREVEAPGLSLTHLQLRLAVPPAGAPAALQVVTTVGEIDFGATIGRYLDVSIRCADAVLDEPVFSCRAAELRGRGSPRHLRQHGEASPGRERGRWA